MSESKCRPTRVVLDTNLFRGDFFMEGPQFEGLFDFMHRTGTRLVLPQIVREELVNQYREYLYEQVGLLRGALNHLKRLKVHIKDAQDYSVDIEGAIVKYRKWINEFDDERIVQEQFHYGGLNVVKLVEHALSAKKPGKGSVHLKDLLIWWVVKEIAENGNDVVLISGNYKDFTDGKRDRDDLAKDLVASLGPDASRPRFYEGIDSYMKVEATSLLPAYTLNWFKQSPVYLEIEDRVFDRIQLLEQDALDVFPLAHGENAQVSIREFSMLPLYVYGTDLDGAHSVTVWLECSYQIRSAILDYFEGSITPIYGERHTTRKAVVTLTVKENNIVIDDIALLVP